MNPPSRTRIARLGTTVVMLLAACQPGKGPMPPPLPPAAEPSHDVALIAREQLFGNPTRVQARISPDGRQLSWLAPVDGVMNIWVAPANDPEAGIAVTADTGRGIRTHFWVPGGAHLVYLQDQGGNENDHVFAVDPAGGLVRDLTPVAPDVRAVVVGTSRLKPGQFLVGLNARDRQLFDLYRVDVATGELALVAENPGFSGWLADNQLELRFGVAQRPGGGSSLMMPDGSGGWTEFLRIPAQDVLTTSFFGFDRDGGRLYGVDSRRRDTAALVAIDVRDGSATVVAEHPHVDIDDVLINPATFDVEAYGATYLRREWQALTPGAAADLERLESRLEGELSFVDATEDGNRIVVYAESPQQPGAYHLYDRRTGVLTQLFDARPELAGAPLQPMFPVALYARDGETLVSYLSLPPGSDEDGSGRPDAPLPMVLFVHGGPWARDTYGYRASHQWLANRGYAVMSVNYRGSTGFGKRFLNAAVGEFARGMHDDLLDGVRWSVAEGIARPDRIAIMGGSYGGYATLVGVTFTPDTFACGVDIVGPSSLVTLVESFPPYWAPFLENTWYKFVGNPSVDADRNRMLARSPITRVGDIRVPLLIGQGENDPRVTRRESDQLVAAMAERGLPVTYVNYPDEGHGFARPENRLSFFAVAEAFLSSCLGGRFEPIGDDFAGSSIRVLHGAEYVPGLADTPVPARQP